jgi:formiminotetrahydrofolate cyclodeaminase
MLSRKPFPELLDAFASSDPTPGGGSAAALAGAVGASLFAMVAGLPKTRTGAPEERTALDAARAALLATQKTLTDLINRDAAAYDLVVAAYRRPKATDEEKTARKAAVQDAMRVAAEIPIETMEACAAALEQGGVVAAHGNPSASSDLGVGMQLLMTAKTGAMLNVLVNLDGITDESVKAALQERLRGLMTRGREGMAGLARASGMTELHKRMGALFAGAHGEAAAVPRAQMAMAAAQMLRRLGIPEAMEALSLLSRSADREIANAVRDSGEADS